MVHPRTWLAIPALAVACGGLALALRSAPLPAVAIAALAAAIAATVRALSGTSIAAALAGGAAALLATFCVLDLRDLELARAALASAAAMFAVSELARPSPTSALPAIGSALAAAALDPSFVVLIAITGVWFVRGPWPRPRWAIAVPVLGAIATVIALAAALTRVGVFADLWSLWAGRSGNAGALAIVVQLADTLGPLGAVAGLAGIGVCMTRGRFAAAAMIAAVVGALATDLACGALGAAAPTIAAVTTGIAIGRLAATIESPLAQPFVGAVTGFLIVVGPALSRA